MISAVKTAETHRDEVMDELYKHKEELSARFHHDVREMGRHYQQLGQKLKASE